MFAANLRRLKVGGGTRGLKSTTLCEPLKVIKITFNELPRRAMGLKGINLFLHFGHFLNVQFGSYV